MRIWNMNMKCMKCNGVEVVDFASEEGCIHLPSLSLEPVDG